MKGARALRRHHFSPVMARASWSTCPPRLPASCNELAVQRGDQVEKEAFLFELEREEERAARAEAEETLRESRARVDKATMDFTRAKSLREKRVIASEAYDTAQQDLLTAQHAAAARQRALEQADWRFAQKQQSAPRQRTGLRYLLQAGGVGSGGHARFVDPPARIHEGALFCSRERTREDADRSPLGNSDGWFGSAARRQSEFRLSAGGIHASDHLQPGEPR